MLPTPGGRTGERTATSASLVVAMSVRLKHLWLECGAGSRWRTCTTIITAIAADTFRDTTGCCFLKRKTPKKPSRPLFFIPPIARWHPRGETTSRVWEVHQFPLSTKLAGTAAILTPEPSVFTPYVTLGVSRAPPLLHRNPFLRGWPFLFLLSLKVYGTKNKEKAEIKVYLRCLAIQHLRYQLFQRPHFPESSA